MGCPPMDPRPRPPPVHISIRSQPGGRTNPELSHKERDGKTFQYPPQVPPGQYPTRRRATAAIRVR